MKQFGSTTFLAALLVCAGCASTPAASEEPDTVQMKDDTVRDLEAQRAEERARRPPPPPVEESMPPEELAVQMYEVRSGEPVVTENGIAISVQSASAPWAFALRKSGQTVQANDPGGELYIEGVAFGELFVFSKFGDATQVTLRSDAPPTPLTVGEASRIADAELDGRVDCSGAKDAGSSEPTGTVRFTVRADDGSTACEILVGRYTREVVDL